MGIVDWLLGLGDEEEGWAGGWTREQPPPIPSKRDLAGQRAKQTDKVPRNVQGQSGPAEDDFDAESEGSGKA